MILKDESEMPFGKYKGLMMIDVPANYLLWLHQTQKYTRDVKLYVLKNLDVLEKEAKEQNNAK